MAARTETRELTAPVKTGGLSLRNRLMRSATAERMSEDDGTPTVQLAEMAGALAAGGTSLVIIGHTFVRPDGKASRAMSGLWRDDQIPTYARIADAVHRAGGKVALQINHAGRQTSEDIISTTPLAPSAVAAGEPYGPARAIEAYEVPGLLCSYANAARRAARAGFDAVQVHAAHGYLISQFLSPEANRRQDNWGGSPERRREFLRQVLGAVRMQVPAGYPILLKMGLADFVVGGLSLDEGLSHLAAVEGMGVSLVEISGGIGPGNTRTGKLPVAEEGYFLDWARRAREVTQLPLALVGGFRSRSVMQAILDEGVTDLISLSRPLIREPDLAAKLTRGESDGATCISCGLCSKNNHVPTRCWVD